MYTDIIIPRAAIQNDGASISIIGPMEGAVGFTEPLKKDLDNFFKKHVNIVKTIDKTMVKTFSLTHKN